MYSVLNTLLEYTYFNASKKITSYTFSLVLKFFKAVSVSLRFRVSVRSKVFMFLAINRFFNDVSLKS